MRLAFNTAQANYSGFTWTKKAEALTLSDDALILNVNSEKLKGLTETTRGALWTDYIRSWFAESQVHESDVYTINGLIRFVPRLESKQNILRIIKDFLKCYKKQKHKNLINWVPVFQDIFNTDGEIPPPKDSFVHETINRSRRRSRPDSLLPRLDPPTFREAVALNVEEFLSRYSSSPADTHITVSGTSGLEFYPTTNEEQPVQEPAPTHPSRN